MCRNTYILIFILGFCANSTRAATYTYQATSFAWEIASTNVVWDQTNTSYPRDDDKQTVNLGFNFTFGGITYTQVRIITNGSLDFGTDQNFHQVYTNTAMPAATVDRMIVPYWDDLNPNGGGTVRYSTLGVGPNRRFVASWENVPVFSNGGSYTLQVIIYENGDIKFQYGAGNANGSSATIGVEVDDSDYTQYSFNSNSVSNGTAILFTAPPAPAARAYYALEENSWSGAGSVIDSLSNFNGSPVGGVAPVLPSTATPPGTCRAGNIPANTSTAIFDAVDTGIDVNSAIGNLGAIGFWYRAATAWNDGNARMLFDASNDLGNGTADKNFYLVKEGNGVLRFQIEDSADTDSAAVTGANSFAANTWHYIAVSWDLPSDRVRLYVDGVLSATSTTNLNGTLGDTTTLYLGDNRNNGMVGTTNYTGNSANGIIDEVRIYNYVRSSGQINIDMNTARPCIVFDHIRILHDGEGLTCAPEQVTVQACSNAACSTLYTGSITTTLTPTGWVGGDTLTFSGGSSSAQLRRTTVSTATLSATGSTPTPTNAARCFNGLTETCTLNFVDAGFIFDVPNLTACKTSASITLSAVKSTDSGTSCAPAFSGPRTVNFWSSYTNPASGTQTVRVNGTAVGTSSPGTGLSLTFNAAAQTTITVNYPDAGQMQLSARYTGSGSEAGLVMNGSDSFVSIPVGLAVYAASSCAAADASCPVFGTAGSTFSLTAKSACWVFDGDTDLSDNPATPNFRLTNIPMSHSLIAPAGGQPGTLALNTFDFIAADNGIHLINQTISEVGVFRFSATPIAGSYFGQTVAAGTSPNIGRFKPRHFALSAGMLTDRVNMSCSPASTFTYMGENLRMEFTLTAQNNSNLTTQNYSGSFAKLNPAIIGNYNIGAIDSSTPTPLSGRIAPQSASGVWTKGNVNVFAIIALNRSAGIDGPYANLALGVDPVDSDSVRLVSYNLDVDNNASNDHGLVANANIRFGRMRLENIFGTELLPLALPLYTEYYSGSQFIRNTTDSCSTYNAASITYSNRQGLSANPIANGNGILFGGNFDPSNPITFNSSSQVGNIDATLNVPAWLQFDWDNNGIHNNNPIAHITFGIYNGSNRQIYSREVY